jgi:hypothetical protein
VSWIDPEFNNFFSAFSAFSAVNPLSKISGLAALLRQTRQCDRRYVAESITPLQAVQLQPTVFSQEIWRNGCRDTGISVKLRLDRFADYDIRDGARWISGRNKSVNGWF